MGVEPGEAYRIFWESNSIGSVKLLAKLMSELKILCNARLASFRLTQEDLKTFKVNKEETDEFISPSLVEEDKNKKFEGMNNGDGLLIGNFRSDRVRQIISSLIDRERDSSHRETLRIERGRE